MDGKPSNWRPGPSVCRCCLSDGCYKDISTEYFWMGKREVYEEMLLDTLDLTISFGSSNAQNSQSRLICEQCIARLRNAADFKKQVKECEQTFLQYLNPSSSNNDIEDEIRLDRDEKHVKVKEEKSHSDGDDFDDRNDFLDDDDDLDDQPLMTLATKVPKKESIDVLDLLDNAKQAGKRKSTAKSKAAPSKKPKIKETKQKAKEKPEKKKKAVKNDPRNNAEVIIKETTAFPFKLNDKCVLCLFCHDSFEDPEEFRRHMGTEHEKFNAKVAFHSVPKPEFIKVDISKLTCRTCAVCFDSIENIATHLKETHDKAIDWEAKMGVIPYRLQLDVYICVICDKTVPSLLHLNRHTVTHFWTHVCHVCGKRYVASTGLLKHVRSIHQDYEVSCRSCGKVFPSYSEKDKHKRRSKECMIYRCAHCPERFNDWKCRKQHMESEHGLSKRSNRCAECNIDFGTGIAYYEHFRLRHSSDCLICKHCGLKFLSQSRLDRHLTKHL